MQTFLHLFAMFLAYSTSKSQSTCGDNHFVFKSDKLVKARQCCGDLYDFCLFGKKSAKMSVAKLFPHCWYERAVGGLTG